MSEFSARYLKDYQVSDFSIETVELTFDLGDKKTKVTSVLTVKKQNLQAKQIELNGEHLTLLSVIYNERELTASSYQVDDSQLVIPTPDQAFTLTITTEINPEENTALEGLFKSDGAFCTQCEAEGFRRITYYLDRPDVMATYTTKVIADKEQYPFLLANGNKIDSGDLPNNKHFVTWHDPFPKPSYLFALVAGNFDLLADKYVTGSGREVALEIFVDKGNLHKAEHAMTSLKKSMKWDEDVFGLEYDLDIYMIVAVDFFNMGAMENKGLNVFNSKFVLADKETATDTDYFNVEAVIAHEYFHNWTGNRVTCRDWFQLSLKEGLTVFRDQQFSADMHSASVTRIQNVRLLRSLQFAEDASPMAHPIRPEKVMEMNNFYTLTVYEKGSEVIRMIHTLLGQENFRKGMDLYFERFDGQAVTCEDFVNAMADASGIDLTQFKRWYSQSGTPIIEATEQYQPDDGYYQLTLKQINEPSKVQQEKHDLQIPVAIELISNGQHLKELLILNQQEQSWQFTGFKDKPVLSILGNFSAPVKVDFTQSDHELTQIMMSADDEFSRWDAGQKLIIKHISALILQENYQLPLNLIEVFKAILASDAQPAFIAEQLTLPNFSELVELFKPVEPIKLVEAIEQVKRFIAEHLTEQLLACYQQLEGKAYDNSAQSIGERALKNSVLSYLALLDHNELLVSQFTGSDNMTDTLAALVNSAVNSSSTFDSMMAEFEQKWSQTPLVMDKWFSLQAQYQGEDTYQRLANLLQHPLFSLKNPNRARSLIGVFAQSNPKYFHCITGRGYQFLTEQICQLNEINPQVASRLITPLIQFADFDPERQVLMKRQLTQIANLDNLSKDLKEKVEAALN